MIVGQILPDSLSVAAAGEREFNQLAVRLTDTGGLAAARRGQLGGGSAEGGSESGGTRLAGSADGFGSDGVSLAALVGDWRPRPRGGRSGIPAACR